MGVCQGHHQNPLYPPRGPQTLSGPPKPLTGTPPRPSLAPQNLFATPPWDPKRPQRPLKPLRDPPGLTLGP